MKTKVLIILACLLLSGCASKFKVPAVSGDVIDYKRTDPLGGTTIHAEGVKVTDKEVTADTASFNVTYPSFSVSLTVTNYRRKREAVDGKP